MAVCVVAAATLALTAAAVVYLGPVHLFGNQIMMAWGWVGWTPAIPVAAIVFISTVLCCWWLLGRANKLKPSLAWVLAVPVAFTCLAWAIASYLNTVGEVRLRWDEQVQLGKGGQTLLKRTASGDAFGMTNPEVWRKPEFSLEFAGGKSADRTIPPLWSSKYRPILVDYDEAKRSWIVVATFESCGDWQTFGRPALPYVQYTSHNENWDIGAVEPSLIGREANLLLRPRSTGEPALVTLLHKQSANRSAADTAQRILDKPWGC